MTEPLSLSFSTNPRTGTWRLASPKTTLANVTTRLFLDGRWVTLFQPARIKKTSGKILISGETETGLSARMTVSHLPGLPAVCLDVELTNHSDKEMILGTLHLMEVGSVRLGTGPRKVFIDSGGGWWAGAVDIESTSPYQEQWDLLPPEDQALARNLLGKAGGPGHHTAIGGMSALYNSRNHSAIIAGFLTFNRASSHVTWLCKDGQGPARGWAASNFANYRLPPGHSVRSEKLFLGLYRDSHRGLEDYATAAGKMMHVKLPKEPPMGWCSWYAYRLKITEDIVLANAKALKQHFGGYNFGYIQADHGWQYKDVTGQWTKTNDRFPHGLPWLARKLDALGYKLGLWLGFFVVLESSPLFKAHPEYMVKDSEGKPQVMPYRWAWEPHDRIYYLDPTHPGAQEFIHKTFTTLRKAGVRYWKIDFTWGIAGNDPATRYHDPACIKGAETYRKGLAQIMDVLGNDYVYWCSNPTSLGFGYGSTSMTACDIGNPGFRQTRQVEGRTEGLDFFRQCATTIISRYFLHRKLILLNPDVVEVGGAADLDEARIRLSLVAFAGGQVFLGDDLTALTEDQWDLLAKCVPPCGQAARPVDLFEHTYPDSYPHVWHLPIRTAWGEWDLVALFNLTEKPSEVRVDFSSLGLQKGANYLVFEFWEKEFLGPRKNSVTRNLKPISTQLLLIKKPSPTPQVLSSDLHVTQGAVELSRVRYDRKSRRLAGIARRQPGEKGNLYIWVPGQRDLIVHPLVFNQSTIRWTVEC